MASFHVTYFFFFPDVAYSPESAYFNQENNVTMRKIKCAIEKSIAVNIMHHL